MTYDKEQFINIQRLLGYKKGLEPKPIGKQYLILSKLLFTLPENKKTGLPSISLDEVISGTKAFYQEHFTLHDILMLNASSLEKLEQGKLGSATIEELTAATISTSPFNLPIFLTEGHSMTGKSYKGVLSPQVSKGKDVKFPATFFKISLGKELTPLSIATYSHEISHTQTESNPGITEDYHNKEVISIFLEKVNALELDPTGQILRKSERMRYRHLLEQISVVYNHLNGGQKFDFKTVLEASMYVESALKAEKLFDMYQQARKPKEKTRILKDIQSVFDAKLSTEELLEKHQITANKGCDLTLTKRHL